MATSFFYEETLPIGGSDMLTLHRYYYNDISAQILVRSFHLLPANVGPIFLHDEHIPLADLRTDLKTVLTQFLCDPQRQKKELAS